VGGGQRHLGGAKTFRPPKLKKVGGAGHPFRRPCVLSGYCKICLALLPPSLKYILSIPIQDLDQLFIRFHHLFQPSVPTDEAGLHQWRTFNCERNISQASKFIIKKRLIGRKYKIHNFIITIYNWKTCFSSLSPDFHQCNKIPLIGSWPRIYRPTLKTRLLYSTTSCSGFCLEMFYFSHFNYNIYYIVT
jgi:hypothetical protein